MQESTKSKLTVFSRLWAVSMVLNVARFDDMLQPEEFIREFSPLTDELGTVVRMAYLYQTAKEADMLYEKRRSLDYESSSGGSGRSSSGGGGGHSGGGGSGIR